MKNLSKSEQLHTDGMPHYYGYLLPLSLVFTLTLAPGKNVQPKKTVVFKCPSNKSCFCVQRAPQFPFVV